MRQTADPREQRRFDTEVGRALATLECRVISRYPGGDHSIFIGEVVTSSIASDKQPLLYFGSKYNRLAPSPVDLAVRS